MEAVTTKTILARDNHQCLYCGERAVQRDHLIKTAGARRSVEARRTRELAQCQVAACRDCNEAIGTRCFVPPSHVHLIPELQRITGSVYGVFDGNPATLRRLLV